MAQMDVTLDKIKALIEATEDSLAVKFDEKTSGMAIDLATLSQKIETMSNKKDVEEFKKALAERDMKMDDIYNILKANQPIIDNYISKENSRKVEKKSFDEGWSDAVQNEIEKKAAEIKNFQTDRGAKIEFRLDMKTMTLSSVTGDTVQSYNNRQGLAPSQKSNFRDLIPTTPSPTGSYVTYRETNSVQVPGVQTEGSAKTDLNYAFTEVKSVSKYIAGKTTFSKQLMFALPFLTNTLPRTLIRDFYKKENDYFYTTAAAAALGSDYIAGATVDAEELLFLISNQIDANYDASYAIVRAREWARILMTKPSDYSIPGGVTIDPSTGFTKFAGTPLVAASWAAQDKVLIFDRDIMERVETESLRVEFSYENNDNFEKNMVTARVECFEELNILRPDGVIYHDFGNS